MNVVTACRACNGIKAQPRAGRIGTGASLRALRAEQGEYLISPTGRSSPTRWNFWCSTFPPIVASSRGRRGGPSRGTAFYRPGAMQDFWRNSGFTWLERDNEDGFPSPDDSCVAYLMRPRIRPVEGSGGMKSPLHEALLDDPRATGGVGAGCRRRTRMPATTTVFLVAFLGRLKARGVLGSPCYLEIFLGRRGRRPPLFIDQPRAAHRGATFSMVATMRSSRAPEALFREQRRSTDDGR